MVFTNQTVVAKFMILETSSNDNPFQHQSVKIVSWRASEGQLLESWDPAKKKELYGIQTCTCVSFWVQQFAVSLHYLPGSNLALRTLTHHSSKRKNRGQGAEFSLSNSAKILQAAVNTCSTKASPLYMIFFFTTEECTLFPTLIPHTFLQFCHSRLDICWASTSSGKAKFQASEVWRKK